MTMAPIEVRGRLNVNVYYFPDESSYDLLQIGWVHDSLYDNIRKYFVYTPYDFPYAWQKLNRVQFDAF
jgi:hypothetical protein